MNLIIYQYNFYLYQRIKKMTCAQSPVYKFVRGYEKNESNPGILVTHNKARYTFHMCNSSGTVLTYHCSSKHVTKCKAKCRVSVLDNEEGKRYVLSQFADFSEHNHPRKKKSLLKK